jgi:tetratricopeptide (TPR) repeat protein
MRHGPLGHCHDLLSSAWEPAVAVGKIPAGQREIQLAQRSKTSTDRERKFIDALGLIRDADTVGYRTRATNYALAMKALAAENRKDPEVQVFYALALLAEASPSDQSHVNQKEAADLLEPLFRAYPQHPGIPHYLIHAYDNVELAARGLPAAKVYSKIAPSAPHALHMPSHIFTRLGLWEASIASNVSAREAAHRQGDTGEELHAMDYLVYAYLQLGRDSDAAKVVQEVKEMTGLNMGDFKIGYAVTAIPTRYAVERGQWAEAAGIVAPAGAGPQVTAIAVWARGIGLVRSGRSAEAPVESDRLREIEAQLRAAGNEYGAKQVGVMEREVRAWLAKSAGNLTEAAATMREAADEEDATEKLPVTPGPIVPAREQLGLLLLEQGQADQAAKEFAMVLSNTPGRRGAMQGAAPAAKRSNPK